MATVFIDLEKVYNMVPRKSFEEKESSNDVCENNVVYV